MAVTVLPPAWRLAQREPFTHGLYHKGTPWNSVSHVSECAVLHRASCWQWWWPFWSATTNLGLQETSSRLGRQGPLESRSLIQRLKHVRAETSLLGVYCRSCQTCSVSRNDCCPLSMERFWSPWEVRSKRDSMKSSQNAWGSGVLLKVIH